MRRALALVIAAAALSGCVSTGYYREYGSADYYYERGSYSSYDYGYGYGGSWSSYPYYAGFGPSYGYGYYGGGFYPSFGYSGWYGGGWPYYGSSWYYPHNDYYHSAWWERQQALARQRERQGNVRNESTAIARMQRDYAPARDGARFSAPPDAGRVSGPAARSWRNADETRQVRTGTVDPYYGTPRQRRGMDAPDRGPAQFGNREAPPRSGAMPPMRGPDAGQGPIPRQRAERPAAPAPMFRAERAPAPMRNSAPAPSFDRAPSSTPSFSPRSMPSSVPSSSGGGGDRRARER